MEPSTISDLFTYSNLKDVGFWVVMFKFVSEAYSAARNGGGLRNILLRFWFGENLPTKVAEDYKKELSQKQSVL